jgi:hypothetical protein
MVTFDKRTEVVTHEDVEIQPGVYYFSTELDDTIAYRRFDVGELKYSEILVRNDDIQSIRHATEEYYPSYVMEQCFSGHKCSKVITESEFYLHYNSVLDGFASSKPTKTLDTSI